MKTKLLLAAAVLTLTMAVQPRAASAQIRQLGAMSADQLMGTFLKLNINDPNNSVETYNALADLSAKLRRQKCIEAATADMNNYYLKYVLALARGDVFRAVVYLQLYKAARERRNNC